MIKGTGLLLGQLIALTTLIGAAVRVKRGRSTSSSLPPQSQRVSLGSSLV